MKKQKLKLVRKRPKRNSFYRDDGLLNEEGLSQMWDLFLTCMEESDIVAECKAREMIRRIWDELSRDFRKEYLVKKPD